MFKDDINNKILFIYKPPGRGFQSPEGSIRE